MKENGLKLYEKVFEFFFIYFVSKSFLLDGIKECMVGEKFKDSESSEFLLFVI